MIRHGNTLPKRIPRQLQNQPRNPIIHRAIPILQLTLKSLAFSDGGIFGYAEDGHRGPPQATREGLPASFVRNAFRILKYATKTILGGPESAKQLTQGDPCARVNRTEQLSGSFLPPSSSTGGGLMGLWMLSFGDRGAAIVEAESMIHARLRVAVKGLIRASLFVGGCQIDPEFIPLIPDESIGRRLTREHTSELLELFKHAPKRQAVGSPAQMFAMPAPRNAISAPKLALHRSICVRPEPLRRLALPTP